MVLLAACQKPNNELVPQVQEQQAKSTERQISIQSSTKSKVTSCNGRLVFADAETFHNMLTTISKMSSEETEAFEARFEGYKSWRKFNCDNAKNEKVELLSYGKNEPSLPSFYTTLINTNREYQIGDTISYLENGKVYFIPQEQESKLKKNGKFNASDLKDASKSVIKTKKHTADNPDESSESRIHIRNYQYQYNYGGITYNQALEIASIGIPTSQNWTTTNLYFILKLDYWYSRWWLKEWRNAGEVRNMSYTNLQGYAEYPGTLVKYFYGDSFVKISNTDASPILASSFGVLVNVDAWRFSLTAGMEIFVPSQGQCSSVPPSYCPNPNLRVASNWQKQY